MHASTHACPVPRSTVTLPLRYPLEQCKVNVYANKLQKLLSSELQDKATELAGECASNETEAVLEITTMCQEEMVDLLERQGVLSLEATSAKNSVSSGGLGDDSGEKQTQLGLRLLWFHHIRSPKKRRDIINWARELGLGGQCKPGW